MCIGSWYIFKLRIIKKNGHGEKWLGTTALRDNINYLI